MKMNTEEEKRGDENDDDARSLHRSIKINLIKNVCAALNISWLPYHLSRVTWKNLIFFHE